MPKIVITGGAGFIGVNAAARFAQRGWEVVVVDSFARPGSGDNIVWLRHRADVMVVELDVRDREGVDRTFAEHRDLAVLLHLAGQVAVTTSVADPRLDCDVNVTGTVNVLEAVRRAEADPVVLHASTNKVYGALSGAAVVDEGRRYLLRDHPDGIGEDHPLDFHSPYGCSKGAADMYVLDYARVYSLRTVSLRQSCIYGPRQFGIEDQGWVAWFAICATLGHPITIYGDGKQVRDVLYVEDLLDCYDRAIASIDRVRGMALNVGGGPANAISLLELLDLLHEVAGLKPACVFGPPRPGDQKVYVSDIGRAARTLDWKPTVSARDGVAMLVDWVRRHRDLLERRPTPGVRPLCR